MNQKRKVVLTAITGIFLVVVFYMITNAITKYTGYVIGNTDKEEDFKLCLRESDIILYINTNNIANTVNEIILIDYLENVEIVNCLRNNQYCVDKEIIQFPTWMINSVKVENDITLEQLKAISGCEIFE